MTRLRVATWNMHGGVGLDGRFDPRRIARVIGELDADVIALQEFGSRLPAFDMCAHLECASGATAIVMPTFQKHGSNFGNVVLTRLPVRATACHALGVAGREPRNAIDVTLDCADRPLRVISAHLGLRAAERRQQIARLSSLLAESATQPTVLLGDFNEWRTPGALCEMDERFGQTLAPSTFPAPFPIVALDRLWVSPDHALVDLRAHKTRSARIASDHLPLIAALELP